MNIQFEEIYENVVEGMVVYDHAGVVISCNKAALKILKTTKESLIGKNNQEMSWVAFTEDEASLRLDNTPSELCLKTKLPQYGMKIKVTSSMGGEQVFIWIRVNASPIFDKENIKAVVVSFVDITEEQTKNQAVLESRIFLKSVLDHSPSAIYVKDIKGIYILVNNEFERAMGLPRDKILGKNDKEIFPMDFAIRMMNMDEQVKQSLKPIHCLEDVPLPLGLRHYHSIKFPIFDKEGSLNAVCGIANDDTEKRALESDFRNSKERLELAIKSGGFGTWDWDLKINKLVWDEHMFQIFGVNKENFKGNYESYESTLFPEDAKRIQREIAECIKLKKHFKSEFRILRSDGKERVIKAESQTFYDVDENPVRLIGVNWDVTEAREQELRFIQNSKMSSLGEMSAGIAHEINNPLAIISAKAQMICNTNDRTFVENETKAILKTVDRISIIINGLKAYARDAANDPFTHITLDILINDILLLCKERLSNNNIDVTLEVAKDLIIECRPTQISQVVLNCLNNSFDALEDLKEKWVKIKVIDLGKEVQIEFSDSGKGIAFEIQDKIMQPFFTTKAVGKGTGLGLSISLGIIGSHSGKMYYNKKSSNTSFIILLPKKQSF